MKRLEEVLQNVNDNHIFPLFWQHGEDEETLRTYMDKIDKSGIRAVCLEARPHPEFVQEKWWNDFDILLEEAKKRDMKIWILDDSHFPTGYANGAIKEKYPQYRKRFLKLHQLEFAGPCNYAQALISYALTDKEDRLEGVYLAKKLGYHEVDPETLTDITEGVRNNQTVEFRLPEGEWKVLVLVSTFQGGEKETENYLNPIVPEATDVLLEAVYEPHYARYKEEFGKTILGFFSDEPRFGNVHGPNGSIGRCPMVLPWCEGLADMLAERFYGNRTGGMSRETGAADVKRFLPLLFVDGKETARQIRYHYMDLVSDLYAENFSNRIGSWCRKHGVEYIGHTIEDNNAHARLGYGAGHFFKAMKGQDMAGIDVVLHQLMPGMDHGYNRAMTSNGWDGEFFHYVLGKLGSSLGHLDPKKQGRVMCEVFGAYGWAEGNRLMKWIADYMLVRGVNEFCPHAFDPKEYPDPDCPPHFYAHGKNPQFQNFRILMDYMNRIAHLLSGGIHRAPAAVLYHGEAEWSGAYMLMQKPCAELTRHQIDFDIVPQQMLVEAEIENGQFRINQENFRALVVPYAEALPEACLRRLLELAEAGVAVFVLEKLPARSSEGTGVYETLARLEQTVRVVSTDELAPEMQRFGIYEVKTETCEPYLRYYHYEQTDGHVLMLVNEAPGGVIETWMETPMEGEVWRYDAFENTLWSETEAVQDCGRLKIRLAAGESAVYCWNNDAAAWPETKNEKDVPGKTVTVLEKRLEGPFRISFSPGGDGEGFSDETILEKLIPVHRIKGREDFTGVIRYETTFFMERKAAAVQIELDTVYEGARVSVNGSEKKVRICPPYVFDVTDAVKEGENRLEIEVTTTLAREQKDWLSQFVLLEPSGITDAVIIRLLET